jgi:hypothetical protein
MTEQNQMKQSFLNKCIHFNGLMNQLCKAGVPYETVRTTDKPFPKNFPCRDRDSNLCPLAKFRTEEEAEKEAAEMMAAGARGLELLAKVVELKAANGQSGTVTCPCGGTAHFVKASSNGHIWASCPKCGTNIRE